MLGLAAVATYGFMDLLQSPRIMGVMRAVLWLTMVGQWPLYGWAYAMVIRDMQAWRDELLAGSSKPPEG